MLFLFPRLCIDVVQFCSKFANCHFAEKKLSSGSHSVALTENQSVDVIPTSRLWRGEGGAVHCFCPRARKKP